MSRHLGQSVSVVLYSALWESAGVGGGEHIQIHSLDVHKFGVIRRSWISAELGLSVIQPTLESRPGLFWWCSGESLIIFFNASSFSDDMLFFVSVSWRIISYLPCPWAQLVCLAFGDAPGTL